MTAAIGSTLPANLDFGPFLTNLYGDRYLHPVNHLAFNQSGSEECYRRYFGERFGKQKCLYLLIGSDSGLLIKYLSKVSLGTGTRVLIVEFPQIISRLSEVYDLTALPANVHLTSTEEWAQSLEALNFVTYAYLNNIFILESIGSTDGHLADYKALYKQVQQELEEKNWAIKANLGNKTFFVRQLQNLAENRHPASCLNDLFPGKTAVLLGAGPSLDEALPWIAENREHLVVIAVSRVSKRLLDIGLSPDLVVTVDPEYVSFQVSRDLLRFDSSVILVQAYHAHPQLLAPWHGRQLYLGPRLPWHSEFSGANTEIHGPTVCNSAVELAWKMGFSQLVLCGVDLCHTPEGVSHSLGNAEREIGRKITDLWQKVENNSGQLAESPPGYYASAVELGQQARRLRAAGCQLINMSALAAKIDGVLYRPLVQIDVASMEDPAQKILQRAYPEDSPRWQADQLQRLRAEVAGMRVRLQKIQNLAEEGLRCNQGLFGQNGKPGDFKYKKKMDAIEKTLNRDYQDLVPLVKQFGFDRFSQIVRPDEQAEWTDAEIEAVGRLYYEAYYHSSKELGEELAAAVARLDCRLEELAECPDLAKLYPQWETDNLHGFKSWRWLQKHGADSLPAALKGSLQDSAEQAEALIFRRIEGWDGKNKQKFFSAKKIKTKAMFFFQQKDLAGLTMLLDGLKTYLEIAGAEELHCLVSGYLAELEERYDAALDAYHQLLSDEGGPSTEEALMRIASIAIRLEDRDNALLALECLAQISPCYQPNYAAILKLLGHFEQAAEVYSDYLTKAPEDLQAMLKLAQLYLEMNAQDAAKMAFDYVLDADPDNALAKSILEELEARNA